MLYRECNEEESAAAFPFNTQSKRDKLYEEEFIEKEIKIYYLDYRTGMEELQ